MSKKGELEKRVAAKLNEVGFSSEGTTTKEFFAVFGKMWSEFPDYNLKVLNYDDWFDAITNWKKKWSGE